LVVVVVADLHATSEPPGDGAQSWLTTRTPRTASEHPLVGLREYLVDHEVQPHLILCAGDICDRADEQALAAAWADLNEVAGSVNARLVATAGNHDLDSRHQHDLDPRGALFDLDPAFPAGTAETRDQYWAKNYTVIDGPAAPDEDDLVEWRVVTVNSSAFHGYAGQEGPELEHGRISQRTVRRLRDDLKSLPAARVKILLVHHHIEQLPNVDLKEQSKIVDGEQLAALLESDSPWLVIHGHKHRGRILYAHGEGSSAAVFAAGSLSAYPYGQTGASGIQNQAYVITFADEATLDTLQLGVAGTFESLAWIDGSGWRTAMASEISLPGKGGFGWRTDLNRLSKRIRKEMKERGATQMSFAEMNEFEPRLAYLAPAGVVGLKNALARLNPSVSLERTEHGDIGQIRLVTGTPSEGGGDGK
jgi:predicted phosphodiesterase